MMRHWKTMQSKVDAMSLRERVLIFAAAAFIVISIADTYLFNPLFVKQKAIFTQALQQEGKLKELQANMQAILQSKQDDMHSPLRARITELKAQLQEDDAYLKSRSDHLVAPDEISGLLEQMLKQNQKLQLVNMETLPLALLIEQPALAADKKPAADSTKPQIYKHGVQITVRGGYLDMVQYLSALEKLPTQMFWSEAVLSVDKYPEAVLTVTVFTLSMDKTWLAV